MFNPGDTVLITEGVHDCEFGCNSDMIDMIGQEAIIVGPHHRKSEAYEIDIDYGEWLWSEECFDLVHDEAENGFTEDFLSIIQV